MLCAAKEGSSLNRSSCMPPAASAGSVAMMSNTLDLGVTGAKRDSPSACLHVLSRTDHPNSFRQLTRLL